MSPPANDNSTPTRPIRVPPALWNSFGAVADHLGTDRSTLLRDFMRWMSFEEGAKMPKRPTVPPDDMPQIAVLPAAVREVTEGSPRSKANARTRYVIHVDAQLAPVLAALVAAEINVGPTYLETTPLQLSTFNRAQAVRMHEVLTAAGLPVVEQDS